MVTTFIKPSNPEKVVWAYYMVLISSFAVVLGHTSAGVQLNTSDPFFWLVSNISNSVTRWSITLFTTLTGFLLLNPNRKYTAKSFYQKRAGRILLPFVVWILFYAGLTVTRRYLAGDAISINNLFVQIFTGHAFYHLWYLYMLVGVYLVIPFMRKIVFSLGKRHLIFICGTLFIIPMIVEAVTFFYSHTGFINGAPVYTWFLYFLGYVLAGYLIGFRYNININTPILLVIFFSSIVITATGCQLLTDKYSFDLGYYFYSPFSPNIIMMTLSAFLLGKKLLTYNPENNFPERGYQLAFGVFLIHPVFIIILNSVGIDPVNFNPLISIPLVAVLIFILSISATFVMKKIPFIRRVV